MEYTGSINTISQGWTTEDAELIQCAQEGNLEAYNELVLKYQAAVYQLSCRILRDEDSAEDITQNVFLKAYHKLPSFYGGSFRAWVMKIATHMCLDELRRLARHPAFSLDAAEPEDDEFSLMDTLPQDGPTPEQEIVRRELKEAVAYTLENLPLDFRMVIELVDVQEMSYAQAAEVLDCPVGTVKSRLSRARMEFAQRLKEVA